MIAQLCAAVAISWCPQVVEVPAFAGKAAIHANLFSRTIYISKGLTLNDDERAFVIGHELGHLQLRYNKHTEEDADQFGVALLKITGYNCKRGLLVLQRVDLARYEKAMKICGQ